MEGFDDIRENFDQSFGVTYRISEMLRDQLKLTNSFSGLNMMNEIAQNIQNQLPKSYGIAKIMDDIAKSAEYQIGRNYSGTSMITEIAKSMRYNKMLEPLTLSPFESFAKAVIPQTTIEAIASISRYHEHIYNGIKTITDSSPWQSLVMPQANNLHYALASISGQIASIATQQGRWSIIDDFEQVTEQAIGFTEAISDTSTEEQKRQFEILISLVKTFLQKHKGLGVSALLMIDIFLRFSDIHQYFDFLQDKPAPITKTDLNEALAKQDSSYHYYIEQITMQLKQSNNYRITNRICEVKTKPKTKSLTVTKLPLDFEVIVIQIHHKWIFVSYFDPHDNLPQTGWIMKKYLDNPKQF